eukprot:CAMPEP_0206055086 /NCGR_PEP_ID=MMETSP1466-20131121/39375_1 /ASSEMBLY_ACC=CAM_ASM_001126 /TAXON_ID=44452 /ORGANISM="Pavlova gyrans, Strain CCMP608" /LENGTH=64 /DNA_ID=CAMNT_0053430307 /DNA_START=87 /DNA_END=278 /DNA_ORIENTATION=-
MREGYAFAPMPLVGVNTGWKLARKELLVMPAKKATLLQVHHPLAHDETISSIRVLLSYGEIKLP